MISDQSAARLKTFFLNELSSRASRPCRIFLSATDMNSKAIVRHASELEPNSAWEDAFNRLQAALGESAVSIFRADVVVKAEAMTWQEFTTEVGKTRRNYFRRGIALPDFSIAFTEQELNANLMLYNTEGGRGKFNQEFADRYCKTRFGREFPKLEPETQIVVFDTAGAFIADGMEIPLPIDGSGHREVSPLDSELCLQIARNAASHLTRQIENNGRFIYGRLPCFNRIVSGYNTLRHFSSTFAMLDVYETYAPNDRSARKEELRQAINRSLDYAAKNFIVWRRMIDGTQVAYVEEPDSKELKLGALGISIVAFAKFTELMHSEKYLPLMNALARAIKTMQNDDGSFVHVLNAGDFTIKAPFRTVYYDGEAVFGMMRLYSLTRDEKLLEASELAFKHFIATDHWKNHDHWLSYAVNELTRYQPKREYFEFGINNFLGHLQFIYHRDTQFPTLMELMAAADTMLERIKKMPDMSDLLERVNFEDFYAAMEARAANMLNGHFYPETAMYFAKPDSIVGSFFIRHHAFRVRNDDIEHFLSGLIAYRRYLARRDHDPQPSAQLLSADKNVDEDNAAENKSIAPLSATKLVDDTVLRVGICQKNRAGFWHPQCTKYAMFFAAKQFNIELFSFNPSDIDFENKTVRGMFLIGNTKVNRVVPFPQIIDNAIMVGEDGARLERLEQDCYVIRHSLRTDKQKTYEILLNDGKYTDFLIQSHVIDSFEQFQKLLGENHNDVIMKPQRGARGIGIVHIQFDGGTYIVNVQNETLKMSPDEFLKFYNENLVRRKHILQPYIVSRTRSGNPFDIRIHARRGARGCFKVSPFPRIGNAAGVVSNIATGGYSMKYETFLQAEYGDDWKMIYDKLKEFGRTFPEYYQQLWATTLFDIGVDMGIQKRGSEYDFKIFEVNTYIDGPFFELEDAVTHFEYFRYIEKNYLKPRAD